MFQGDPGYWKFNNGLLKTPPFIKMMNEILDVAINDCDSNCSYTDRWDLCNVEIRFFCTAFGERLSNQKKKKKERKEKK